MFWKGKLYSEIRECLNAAYGDFYYLMATIKSWFKDFQHGRTYTFDEARPGAPKKATTVDNVSKVHHLVLADRYLKLREIAGIEGISKDVWVLSCMKFWA